MQSVILVAGEQRIPQIKGYPELKVASDIEPGKGPLGGIYTGLKTSTTRLNLVVAGDMPFLNRNLLRQMLKQRGNIENGQKVIMYLGNAKHILEVFQFFKSHKK